MIAKMEWLLKWYCQRDWFFFKFGCNTALRASDIVRLRVRDVRGVHLNMKELKTRKYRRFFINDSLRADIEEYTRFMDDDDFLFRYLDENRAPTIGAFYRVFRQCADRLDLRYIGTHTCRKTFGYHYYRRTKDIARLMLLLNHSSESQTLKYIGVLQDDLDDSVRDFYI